MAAVTFRNATAEVAPLAAPLIAADFPHLLKHNVRIEYVFRSKTSIKNGLSVWGMCRKVSSLNAFLAAREETPEEKRQEPFFVIDLSEPVWRYLNAKHREALLHHELCHAGAEYDDKSNTKLFLIPHDLEEFKATYAKYGAWSEAIKNFLAATEPELDFSEQREENANAAPAPDPNAGRRIALPNVQYPQLGATFGLPGINGSELKGSLPATGLLQIEGASPPDATSDVLEADYTELPRETIPDSSLMGELVEDLRTSKRRLGEILQGGLPRVGDGGGAQVIRLQGARYVVVWANQASSAVECRRVVQSSEWTKERLPYVDLSKSGAPCCIGMQVVDTDGVHWVIDSDVVYQVLALERKVA